MGKRRFLLVLAFLLLITALTMARIFGVNYQPSNTQATSTTIPTPTATFDIYQLPTETTGDYMRCNNKLSEEPFMVTTGLKWHMDDPNTPVILIPLEPVFVNKNTNLQVGLNTIGLIRNAEIEKITTFQSYLCSNRITHYTYRGKPYVDEVTQLTEWARSIRQGVYMCPERWDCTQEFRYVIIDNNEIVAQGYLDR